MDRTAFVADLKKRTFDFFWHLADSGTWQIPDRYPTRTFTSIAATGFGLGAYLVGVENGYIGRQQAAERTLHTMEWLWHSVQGPQTQGTSGYKGFYYHFLHYGTGQRYAQVELSTIDTGLLMAGILATQSYFDAASGTEHRIRQLADSLYLRTDWAWAMNGQRWMSMGWHPESGFIRAQWKGYNEAMVLLLMALGSPTHPIDDRAWADWCSGYEWMNFQGLPHVNFDPLFGHQYSHLFIDFRGIRDAYMRERGIDYFENSRRATLANRAYCIQNPGRFVGYNDSIWGLTACDGPTDYIRPADARRSDTHEPFEFYSYRARGASGQQQVDDGTLAPTAAGGSVPFAPEECLQTLHAMYRLYGDSLYRRYGFTDAFNLSIEDARTGSVGWFDVDYLGIDQGPILLQIENYQSELIWRQMRKNKYILAGLRKAGFAGGWLDE